MPPLWVRAGRVVLLGSHAIPLGRAGPWLTYLHRHPDMVALVRRLTSNERLVPMQNLAYMYYSAGSFIHLHTDLPACEITLLTSVVGQVPPLVVYPRLRSKGVQELMQAATLANGEPEGGRRVEVPANGFLALFGRELPHRRPLFPAESSQVVLATLCYSTRASAGR